MGARAATTADEARCSAFASAVLPVTQPPQLKPMIARRIAPPAAPHKAGVKDDDTFMVMAFHYDKGRRRLRYYSRKNVVPTRRSARHRFAARINSVLIAG